MRAARTSSPDGTRPSRRSAALGAVVSVSLLAAACGGSDDSLTSVPASEPVLDEAMGEIAIEEPADSSPVTEPAATDPATTDPAGTDPASTDVATTGVSTAPAGTGTDGGDDLRVVSLSPTHTEIMYAIDAGDQLVAVDEYSNFPAEALDLPNELSGFEPNVEAIAAYEPDLVLIGGDFNGLGPQLEELGIDFFDGPTAQSFDDVYAQIDEVGMLVGRESEAEQLVATMQADIEEIVAAAPRTDPALSVYHEVDSTYYSADSSSFIGSIYSLFGLENIADRAEGESFGFPQLNAEAIISADPDLIFLPCGTFCFTTPDEVAARPGWDAIAAVRNGDVIEVDEDVASRWGPRVVDYVRDVSGAIQQVVAAG